MFFKISVLSRPEVFFKTSIQINLAKCTGRHLFRSLFFNKVDRVTAYFRFRFYKLFLQKKSFTSVLGSNQEKNVHREIPF